MNTFKSSKSADSRIGKLKTFKIFNFSLIFLFFGYSCTPGQDQPHTVPEEWVKERVTETRSRLNESPAGQKIWESMQAHGGLENWFSQGPLQFQFNYQPLDGKVARNTIQVSDNWSAKVRHQLALDTSIQFGWDGTRAWALPEAKAIPFDARFWALTPYYFVGIPFVMGDEGVILEDIGQGKLNEKDFDLIKVTFQDGVGDAPDDFYVVYLDPQSAKVAAYRYVVSYPAYFPDGGHSPEKIMILEGEQNLQGLLFPRAYQTYMWEDESPGEYVTSIELSKIAFLTDLDGDYFEIPEGAEVVE